MKKLIIVMVLFCVILIGAGCIKDKDPDEALNNDAEVSQDPELSGGDEVTTEDDNSIDSLPREIVEELEKKEYLLRHFKLTYDDYKKVFEQYMDDGTVIDDQMLYIATVGITDKPLTMKDFIGKDIEATKELIREQFKGTSDDFWEYYIPANNRVDKYKHIMKISQVYPDYSKDDWFHVYVMADLQGEEMYNFSRKKYTLKKEGETYKVIHKALSWITMFDIDTLAKFTKKDFEQFLAEKPGGDKVYEVEIDMRALIGEKSEEVNWDSYFKSE